MKYIDKLRQDHPEWSEFELGYATGAKCPGDFGYDEHCLTGEGCGDDVCAQCWNQKCPEPDVNATVSKNPNDLVDIAKQAARVRDAFDDAMGIDSSEPHILDSGDRTQFASGAVRDMREGKGRCDLSPVDVAARVFCDPVLNPREYDQNLDDIAKFQQTGNTNYLYYVLRRFAMTEYGGSETMLLEVAKHFEEGAKKYGPDNWRKSIPVYCYIDSAVRHYLKHRRGDNDEPHSRAFCWNLMCCIWEVDYGEEWREAKKEADLNV